MPTHWDQSLARSKCTAARSESQAKNFSPLYRLFLHINQCTRRNSGGPSRVAALDKFRCTEPPLEFYVDFETVNDLNDDFSLIPKRGGLP